jgi:anti-anti-sigma regulatory factor
MVAAIAAGVLLGLVLFAVRNARRPVRAVLTGSQVSSNCARSRADLQRLARCGHELVAIELEGDLFFGAVQEIEAQFMRALDRARVLVVDWSAVTHVDSSAVAVMRKIERAAAARDVELVHVDPARHAPEVAASLQFGADARLAPDIDHALEIAENRLLQLHGPEAAGAATGMLDAVSVLRGFDEAERAVLERQMPQQLVRAGETVMQAGEAGDELMVVLQGSASILVPGPRGVPVRVAGVRRGGVIGELAFLDQSTRSATVRAEEDLTVAVLRRKQYDDLSRTHPQLVQKLLSNLALDLAARLRHTNRLATARLARH